MNFKESARNIFESSFHWYAYIGLSLILLSGILLVFGILKTTMVLNYIWVYYFYMIPYFIITPFIIYSEIKKKVKVVDLRKPGDNE